MKFVDLLSTYLRLLSSKSVATEPSDSNTLGLSLLMPHGSSHIPSAALIAQNLAPAVPAPLPAPQAPSPAAPPPTIIEDVHIVKVEPEPVPVKAAVFADSSITLSGGKPIIQSINEYRARASLPPMVWDERLVANAAKTGQATNGAQLEHQMNHGTFGQVLVYGIDDAGRCGRDMGGYTPFELFYNSWLCENPADPGIAGQCPAVLAMSRIDNMGQIGHWQILSSREYKKIGCSFTRNPNAPSCTGFDGIWACDLGH
jgi:uncharacterized protein YkwD